MKVLNTFIKLVKKELLLSIFCFLTILSCIIIPIDMEYLNYFEPKTLVCLFCMLVVVAGLKNTNVFDIISKKIISLFKNTRSVIMALVFGTFLFDMIVANDMSLITFLPLTYLVLHSTNNDKYLAFTFIMQNIAANMGGMITPYVNPQNLYLYSFYEIDTAEFFTILLPQYFLIALLLFICCMFIKKEPLKLKNKKSSKFDKEKALIYGCLFVLTILSVFRIVPYFISVLLICIYVFFKDRERFKNVDYALLMTFIVFFIFSGNIARIPFIKEVISSVVIDNTLIAGILSCQFISNVPTAIFLSKFTTNYNDLLVAVNVGSLGIIISSLASLITFKEFLKHQPENWIKYLSLFTIFNTLFLGIIILFTL